MVGAVTRVTRGHPTLRGKLVQGAVERQNRVRRRREPPLAATLVETDPLIVQVQAQRTSASGRRLEARAPREHEAEPGDSLDALVGRRDQVVRAERGHGQRHAAEGRHRVHDQLDTALPAQPADRTDFVEHAGARLAVDDREVRRVRARVEGRGDTPRIDRSGLTVIDHHAVDPEPRRDRCDAPPVGAVGDGHQGTVAGHDRTDRRLDHEGSAALHQDCGPVVGGALVHGERDQAPAHGLDDPLVVVVPRRNVAEHRRLDGRARRQWPRREKQMVLIQRRTSGGGHLGAEPPRRHQHVERSNDRPATSPRQATGRTRDSSGFLVGSTGSSVVGEKAAKSGTWGLVGRWVTRSTEPTRTE